MKYDYSNLEGKIKQVCGSQMEFAKAVGISEHSVSCKLSGKSFWKQAEIERSVDVLHIDRMDIGSYFFTLKVQ